VPEKRGAEIAQGGVIFRRMGEKRKPSAVLEKRGEQDRRKGGVGCTKCAGDDRRKKMGGSPPPRAQVLAFGGKTPKSEKKGGAEGPLMRNERDGSGAEPSLLGGKKSRKNHWQAGRTEHLACANKTPMSKRERKQ